MHKGLCKKRTTIHNRLKHMMKDEKIAANEYRCDARKADPKIAKVLRHIAKQEDHHYRELWEIDSQLKPKRKTKRR